MGCAGVYAIAVKAGIESCETGWISRDLRPLGVLDSCFRRNGRGEESKCPQNLGVRRTRILDSSLRSE